MCEGSKECKKCGTRRSQGSVANKATVKMFDGRKVVVVPVVMARGDVVMNGGLFPVEEYDPLSWAGIPVTVGHPTKNGSFASARAPDIQEEWVVGTLYNVQVVDNTLRADAFIDITKADQIYPGLVTDLVKGTPVDVSTGYHCSSEAASGSLNGREYHEVHRDVVPDHLALLPGDEGACNWDDGCGVRSNLREITLTKVRAALKTITNALSGGKKKSPATVDEIISNARSPYTEEDRESLTKMSANTLAKIASQLEEDEEEEVEANEETEEDKKKEEMRKKNEEDKEEEEVENEEDEEEEEKKGPLSPADREAMNVVRRHAADHRRSLVSKITANSQMKAKELTSFSILQLEAVANGLTPASYAGRAAPTVGEADERANEMLSTGVMNAIRKK